MAKYNLLILRILLLLNMSLITHELCTAKQSKIKSTLRGHYKNVLNLNSGSLISSRSQNGFIGGNSGSCMRDTIYPSNKYTECSIGQSIKFDLYRKYELNTLKIWFWDGDNRYYRFSLYIILENRETKIYDNSAKSVFTIEFPDQLVEGFRIQNITFKNVYIKCSWEYSQILQDPCTFNAVQHIVKIEAYYKQSTYILK